MKTIFTLIAGLISQSAMAANLNWYDAHRSTCVSLQHALQREGMFVVLTGEDLYTRPVSLPSYCMVGEQYKSFATKTVDSEKCSLGFVCYMK